MIPNWKDIAFVLLHILFHQEGVHANVESCRTYQFSAINPAYPRFNYLSIYLYNDQNKSPKAISRRLPKQYKTKIYTPANNAKQKLYTWNEKKH